MATTIKIKNSSTSGAIPTAGNLVQGELAVNLADRKIFSKTSGGTVVELSGGARGASSDDVFYENSQVVTASYTITAGKNAMTTGDITINSGVTVTVPSGSRWVII
jgi:hypothetical protein